MGETCLFSDTPPVSMLPAGNYLPLLLGQAGAGSVAAIDRGGIRTLISSIGRYQGQPVDSCSRVRARSNGLWHPYLPCRAMLGLKQIA
jgi:hypothetical protein